MSRTSNKESHSVFRTKAWTQAWLDTWGKDVSKELIDLGGRGNPLEMLYRVPHRFKGIVPVSVLCLVGNGFGALSTPRSEYNDISDLIQAAGSIDALSKELHEIPWQQMHLPDIADGTHEDDDVCSLLDFEFWGNHLIKQEPGYSIENITFEDYLVSLSASTRLAYFNRRSRLANHGEIERRPHSLRELDNFLSLLNSFHEQRWGKPCFSGISALFLNNFCQRLFDAGGKSVFESILIDGQPVSVIFDVIWKNRRYNIQSGYCQSLVHKVQLGSLHLGYAIEDALKAGQSYDLLAGRGQKTDYKASIANHTTIMNCYVATRTYWRVIKSIQKILAEKSVINSRSSK